MDWYIGSEWKLEQKGLRKQVLAIQFQQLDKPTEVSKVLILIEDVQQLSAERPTVYLATNKIGMEHELEMGMARTPIDYYVELLARQMIVGERAHCFITTKASAEISFVMTLSKILESRELYTMKVKEMYELALRYKEAGVAMFNMYPRFAHEYFARAAKFLISYKPFDELPADCDLKTSKDMEILFINIQTNLAACLLQQQRYEHVLYQTQFVDTMTPATAPSEKAIFRRATALYNTKDFEEALKLIEKVENYQEKKDFAKLYARIIESWKSSNVEYKHVVQRMFS